MPFSENSFKDEHGIDIFYYEWTPTNRRVPRGVVQIVHGIGEHAKRYDDFAKALNAASYIVYADDHRGHGQTGLGQTQGDLSKMGKLGPGGWDATLAEIRALTKIIKEKHPDLPLTLIGHSWGSFMTQDILGIDSTPYDAVMLSGSAFRTLTGLNSGPLNKKYDKHPNATGFEWLSRDVEVAKAFVEDELTFYADVMKKFGLKDGLRFFGKPKKPATDIPMLIAAGTEDPVGGEKSVTKLADYYRSKYLSNVTLKLYPDARHEIFNETNKEEVYKDTIEWINQAVSGAR
ncbi:MAG: alpha/beta hydrolase [Microbacteriaceae bacterium]|nr:alpha/beta hydrolase [Microbacteriaceae bacterium]